MKKIFERLAIFFVGLPLIIASVFFLPYKNYLVLHIEILVFSFLAILEMRNLISKKIDVHSILACSIFGLLIPIAAFLYAVFGFPQRIITHSIAISFFSVLFLEFLLSFSGDFSKSLNRIVSSLFIILYPGYLVMYLSIITVWQNAGIILSLFFLMVFSCDSLAWFFGILFGKNNRGFIKASPKKSLSGFFGGYLGTILSGILFYYFFPAVFPGSIIKIIILAICSATAAIIGDIIESILKRSVDIKDSGHIIPGRGGVLDSIDSILLAAPIFYILCDFFWNFAT